LALNIGAFQGGSRFSCRELALRILAPCRACEYPYTDYWDDLVGRLSSLSELPLLAAPLNQSDRP